MDEVAAAVGVTKPLLYNYFGNKERLFIACMDQAGDALVNTVLGAVGRATNPGDALANGLRAFFGFVDEDRAAWAVLFDETLPAAGAVADSVNEYRRQLGALVVGALLEQFPPDRRNRVRTEVEALSIAVLGAAEALARWWLRNPEALSAGEAADLLIATVEPGLRMRSGKGEPKP